MNIYAEFNRSANSHIATIEECEVLTDDIIKSARTFIINAEKWDSSAGRPVAEVLCSRLLKEIADSNVNSELLEELKDEGSERLYNVWKRCKHA